MSLPEPQHLRLGFVSGRFVHVSADGDLFTDAGLGRLIDALGQRCASLNVAISVCPTRRPLDDHRLQLNRHQLVPLPYMPSYARGAHRFLSCRAAIRELERRSDALIVQLPFQVMPALFRPRTPRVYHLCADVLQVARVNPSYRGIRRAAGIFLAELMHRVATRLVAAPSTRLVANGAELFTLFPHANGRAVLSTTLRAAEIASQVRHRPFDAPFRILFVGYLRPPKGIDTLLDAFKLLQKEVPDAELVLAGDGASSDLMADLTRTRAVKLLGPLGFGPKLFAVYADADVLALPSRSEGTPRVLVEARAFGCPVVASRVGGIPTSVTHERDGLLVPAGDPLALKDALMRVARDSVLRASLIARGFERVRCCTIEAFARSILDELYLIEPPSKVNPNETATARAPGLSPRPDGP